VLRTKDVIVTILEIEFGGALNLEFSFFDAQMTVLKLEYTEKLPSSLPRPLFAGVFG
jgi:hypothetical protein